MSDTPLILGSLYGLRTWRVGVDAHGEHITATCQTTRWPCGGTWLHAACSGPEGHAVPDAGCPCGIYALHPRRSSARRVLASRFEVPGIVEAAGAIELQDDGFRAERARPYAFVVTPGRNAKLTARLARRYGAQVVEVAGADALVAWCRQRGLGLDEPTVDELLGPDRARERRMAQRRKLRWDALRAATAVVLTGALLIGGFEVASGPASPRGIYGRTGWVKRPSCATPCATPRRTPGAPGRAP